MKSLKLKNKTFKTIIDGVNVYTTTDEAVVVMWGGAVAARVSDDLTINILTDAVDYEDCVIVYDRLDDIIGDAYLFAIHHEVGHVLRGDVTKFFSYSKYVRLLVAIRDYFKNELGADNYAALKTGINTTRLFINLMNRLSEANRLQKFLLNSRIHQLEVISA